MTERGGRSIIAAAAIIGACLAVGAVGGLLTSSSVETWFPTLAKPAWNPPSWVFGPVWTVLYVLMGVALWLVWRQVGLSRARRANVLFASQLALNLGWSLLFFGLRSPTLALAEIVCLLVVIVLTTVEFRRHSRAAALLMAPYILWVSFASTLNAGIVYLNR